MLQVERQMQYLEGKFNACCALTSLVAQSAPPVAKATLNKGLFLALPSALAASISQYGFLRLVGPAFVSI